MLPAPFAALDWGFAGRSVGTPTHGVWTHEVDSRTRHPERDAPDEGDTSPHPTMEGVTLEKGRMRHPESGEVREYEEAWRGVEVSAVRGERVSVVLEMEMAASEERGVIVRVGQFCQGIVRVGDEIVVERWVWSDEEGVWARVARIGDAAATLPCDATWAETVREGDKIARDGFVWSVTAAKAW